MSIQEIYYHEIPENSWKKLAETSFTQMRYFFRKSHLQSWKDIAEDKTTTTEEREKMECNIQAAILAKQKKVPYCQDCGTDVCYIFGNNFEKFGGNFLQEIQAGATSARTQNPFRSSVFLPVKNTSPLVEETQMGLSKKNTEKFTEKNSGDNSPIEINFFPAQKDQNPEEIHGIFCNKGGGSGSKLWNFSCPPFLLQDEEALEKYLIEKIKSIGHAACPPYHLSITLGGLSQLQNSQILTLLTVDHEEFPEYMQTKRDQCLEKKIHKILETSEMGAQGKGKYFVLPDGLRIYRAPRHAAHFFVGIGVGCSAHRVQKFKITKDGKFFLEKLEKNPEKYLPQNPVATLIHHVAQKQKTEAIKINLQEKDALQKLQNLKSGDNIILSGNVLGARDKAHARWKSNFEKTGKIPAYLKENIAVFYVGPSDTPEGEIIGSFGPTTANRMDDFAEFLAKNGNLIPLSLAKGTRSKNFAKNCGEFARMFGAIQGGPASLLRDHVISQEVLDFEDLGMEAVRLYEICDMPVQIIVDSRGRDYYAEISDTIRF